MTQLIKKIDCEYYEDKTVNITKSYCIIIKICSSGYPNQTRGYTNGELPLPNHNVENHAHIITIKIDNPLHYKQTFNATAVILHTSSFYREVSEYKKIAISMSTYRHFLSGLLFIYLCYTENSVFTTS